jgi:urease accessory protein
MSALSKFRLLQLASQALPIGGFSYSNGLESAIEAKRVTDSASAGAWIVDVLRFSIVPFDVPLLEDMTRAWIQDDFGTVRKLNDEFLASRESAELRAAAVQMGYSLRMLCTALPDLTLRWLDVLNALEEPGLPCVWAALGVSWSIDLEDLVSGYVWAFIENQTLAAVKAVPLGQSAAQKMLGEVSARATVLLATPRISAPWTNFAPGLAVLSALHETQYSRLFRS